MLRNNPATFTSASILLGFTALMSPLVPTAQAATLTYTGTTIGAPTWNRPVDNFANPPVAISGGAGEAVPYSSFGFNVSAPGNYVFQSTATSPNFDNYTFLYQDSFNPTSPFLNILIGNDDNPTPGLSGFTKALSAGTNYFFVTTGFDNTDAGTFSNTITGAGNISAITATSVPEPATFLGTLAAFGYGVYFRRKNQLTRSIDKTTT